MNKLAMEAPQLHKTSQIWLKGSDVIVRRACGVSTWRCTRGLSLKQLSALTRITEKVRHTIQIRNRNSSFILRDL